MALRNYVYGLGTPSRSCGGTFAPGLLLQDTILLVARDNKLYSAPIQSIKEKLWSPESCKLNRSTRLAFTRSTHNMAVNINH